MHPKQRESLTILEILCYYNLSQIIDSNNYAVQNLILDADCTDDSFLWYICYTHAYIIQAYIKKMSLYVVYYRKKIKN